MNTSFYLGGFLVGTIDEVPTEPHFQILVSEPKQVYTPGWDANDSGYTSSVEHISVYAFKNRSDLDEAVTRLLKDNSKFVFHSVGSAGRAIVNTIVELNAK